MPEEIMSPETSALYDGLWGARWGEPDKQLRVTAYAAHQWEQVASMLTMMSAAPATDETGPEALARAIAAVSSEARRLRIREAELRTEVQQQGLA